MDVGTPFPSPPLPRRKMLWALLALQVATPLPAPVDSVRRKTIPVTAALLASAFRDSSARELLARARRTRILQDSSLTSYDATAKQRFSVFASIGPIGREHLAYRHESASRVQWQRDVGARVDMLGARVAVPISGSDKVDRDALRDQATQFEMSPVPYFPGSEAMWAGGGRARADVAMSREGSLINPLAGGAEAYYTYRTGGEVSLRLQAGKSIVLRELEIRPRMTRSNLLVGSLWIDVESGHLVRAIYRMAAPSSMKIGVTSKDSTKKAPKIMTFVLSSLLSPASAEITAITVEYGLYEGRFWLPRSQSAEGRMQAMFAHVPVKFENTFSYASVNGTMSLAKIVIDSSVLTSDSVRRARRREKGLEQCDVPGAESRVVTQLRAGQLPVEVHVPCDLDKLEHSPELPASIYDDGASTFGSADRENMINESLRMGAQSPFSLARLALLPPPRVQFGPSMTRFNRVEGLSTGLAVEQLLGGGYSARAVGRYGFSDRVPNFEFGVSRSNAIRTIRLNGYSKLVSANDWGDPLTFGAGVSALFGRDEGFYYRAAGAELQFTTERGAHLDWRAFAEHQKAATQTRTGGLVGDDFEPNIAAASGNFYGLGVRQLHSYGVDPHGFRGFTDLRVEGAGGDSTYGRGALEVSLSRELARKFIAALTLGGGSSVGELPVQRRWFLGGASTVRGQSADSAQSGNAFWLGRGEVARAFDGYRLTLFGDLGWTGDRTKLSEVGRPLSGYGVGLSAFDGIIRLDLARGVFPRKQARVLLYLDARF
ncbi:MAG: hypothetical protein JWO05_1534 [Gemmatimonadetes bacterium]|nr:hypothetical protein [Gemmatimonadota bacterium]